MRRYLPAFVLLLMIFFSAGAQTRKDSIAWRLHPDTTGQKPVLPADSTIKHIPADTIIKHAPARPVKKSSADSSVAKHLNTDSTTKRPLNDSVLAKHLMLDSTAKQPHIDSAVVKHITPDSAVKKPPVDSVAKQMVVVTKPLADSADKLPHPKIVAKLPATAVPEIKHSTVKTMSDERYNALLKGEDIDNMALAGVLNHYPLPDRALKYKAQLGLNPGQLAKLKDIAAGLLRKKMEMGVFIIRNEKVLDSLFVMKQADDGMIIFYTNRYGLYQGELRNAILQACYKTREVLSEDQIKKLEGLEKEVK